MNKTYLKKLWQSKANISNRIFSKFVRFNIGIFKIFSVDPQSQHNAFKSIGLDREAGLEKLNSILTECYGISYSENNAMFSEHLPLFAAIAVANRDIGNILEIGTHDGRTSKILSLLFPQAEILTIDLPDDSPVFSDTYGRSDDVDAFVVSRDKQLKDCKNLKYTAMNSIELVNQTGKFDLIWIDGAHGYPVIAMDIINSYRLSKQGAYVVIDDVWTRRAKSDDMYDSIGGYESLEALKSAKLIEQYYLINKRLGAVFNSPSEKKYIAVYLRP